MEIDKEDLKNETKDAVNQVKETLKNVDINKEAKETKGFIKEMMANPFEKVSNIANGKEEAFKKSVVLILIYMISAVAVTIITKFKYVYGTILNNITDIIMAAINPVLIIVVPALIIVVLMNKTNKKSLTTVIATLTVANIPIIFGRIITIVSSIFIRLAIVISPITTTLGIVATVLEFYGMKALFGENKETFISKFVIIQVISALVLYIV